jgi:hypothetical protein
MKVATGMIRRGWLAAVAVLAVLGQTLGAAPTAAAGCGFGLGFATLRDQIPGIVGACLEDEHHDAATGDAVQRTTQGLLAWRKADNWTAFTDGYHTWVDGPDGVQERLNTQRFPWEGGSAQTDAPRAAPEMEAARTIPAGTVAGGWLGRLDFLRGLAGLPGVVEDPSLDPGAAAHARYMVETGTVAHAEDPASPAYTSAGNAAAAASELIAFSWVNSDANAVDGLIAGPFHALGLLDPSLATVGFASYRDPTKALQTAAAVHLGAGWGAGRTAGSGPVMWPEDGARLPLYTAAPGEHPDPLAPCGYAQPAGLPLIFEYGEGGRATSVGDHALLRDGAPADHCVYDASSYTNPDPAAQAEGQAILGDYHAVVVVPRRPLTPGSTYTVHLVVNGEPYSWSFLAAPPDPLIRRQAAST